MSSIYIGSKGDEWRLDEGELHHMASSIIEGNQDSLSHVDLARVVFVTVNNAPTTGKPWLGKCIRVKPPLTLLLHTGAMRALERGLTNEENEAMDIKYIIALNEDEMNELGVDDNLIRQGVIHHELLHIREDMEGLNDHDVQDFASILEHYGLRWTKGMISLSTDSDSFTEESR